MCGLAGAFYKLGLDFDIVKVGPDFLDPICVSNFACATKLNLQPQRSEQFYRWLAWVRPCSLVEDCMGIMDSSGDNRLAASTLLFSESNKLVLVLNCRNVMQTAAHLSPAICSKLSGIILNNTVSYKHEAVITSAVSQIVNAPILGALPAHSISFKKRYLGIIQISELANSREVIDDLVLRTYYNCNVSRLVRFITEGDN
ncbi:MAG: hypothetical protein AAI946_00365 [Candidatus Hodgkinia cicadicola]